uniref:(northern house mosquito) hypothetical protein n=1 Tax=Culex pipiens TaxID=7175 RepID=A0A8D8FUP2_CULPI
MQCSGRLPIRSVPATVSSKLIVLSSYVYSSSPDRTDGTMMASSMPVDSFLLARPVRGRSSTGDILGSFEIPNALMATDDKIAENSFRRRAGSLCRRRSARLVSKSARTSSRMLDLGRASGSSDDLTGPHAP